MFVKECYTEPPFTFINYCKITTNYEFIAYRMVGYGPDGEQKALILKAAASHIPLALVKYRGFRYLKAV